MKIRRQTGKPAPPRYNWPDPQPTPFCFDHTGQDGRRLEYPIPLADEAKARSWMDFLVKNYPETYRNPHFRRTRDTDENLPAKG
jgi:hypothetical protein